MSDAIRIASTALAALELLPAEPGDLTQILRDPSETAALLARKTDAVRYPLTAYLCDHLDEGRIESWHKQLESLLRSGRQLPILAGTPRYPVALAECWDAPPILFVDGAIPYGPAISIVGSRAADDDAIADARQLAADLARVGYVIVSGLAAGVDTAAHNGALDADCRTVAVMGTGIESVYPPENTELAARITASGALVSQFAPRAPRTGTSFLKRNHVIAGLSQASIVMDGRKRSGSRHELEQAMAYRRAAMIWEPTLAGERWARTLCARGDAVFVSSADDVRRYLAER